MQAPVTPQQRQAAQREIVRQMEQGAEAYSGEFDPHDLPTRDLKLTLPGIHARGFLFHPAGLPSSHC